MAPSMRSAAAPAPGDAATAVPIRRCGTSRAQIRFAPFTAALFRCELFQRVGLLDEDFESYLEDIDFGIRCAAAGLRASTFPRPSPIIRAAPLWGVGIPTL